MGNIRDKYSDEEWDELSKNVYKSNLEPLLLSPNESIDENVKLFNSWLKRVYK